MLTPEQLDTILEARQQWLEGDPIINIIPDRWADDLLTMLSDMALRNEILRVENRNLRMILGLSKGSDK